MLGENCLTGPEGYWERKREEKQRFIKCHQIWFAVGLTSCCINLSSKSHLIELENTSENTMNSESFRKSSQWAGCGQSLAVSWNHSVPIFPSHWGLISPYLYFLHHVCDIFVLSFSDFSSCSSLFLLPCTGAENVLCSRGSCHNQSIWGKLPLQGEGQFFSLLMKHPVCSPQHSWQLSGEELLSMLR